MKVSNRSQSKEVGVENLFLALPQTNIVYHNCNKS